MDSKMWENRSVFQDSRLVCVLDIANNHQGSVIHAQKLIEEHARIVSKFDVRSVFKFQFRDLDTFLNPRASSYESNKHVKRFLETRLTWDEYFGLHEYAKSCGFETMCTPFDEVSASKVKEFGFDYVKVASCSAKDWPLLSEVAGLGLPVVVSTGGLTVLEVDALVSFLSHRVSRYSLMHCVSIYPTKNEQCNIRNIAFFKNRYRGLQVGWSTHEGPDETHIGGIALACGAQVFERHVGLPSAEIALNDYSSSPEQLENWLKALCDVESILGSYRREDPVDLELKALKELGRGIVARRDLKKKNKLIDADVSFKFPCDDGQAGADCWRAGSSLELPVYKEESISSDNFRRPSSVTDDVFSVAHSAKALLNEANIRLGSEFDVEYSHHYGPDKFREVGAVLITCINREYCKKLVIQIEGQKHPRHFHKRKEETFQILHGRAFIEVDGVVKLYHPGDQVLVRPGVWHSFWTDEGVVIEEISTTHFKGDSVYEESVINEADLSFRKTRVSGWGRFEIRAAIEGESQ